MPSHRSRSPSRSQSTRATARPSSGKSKPLTAEMLAKRAPPMFRKHVESQAPEDRNVNEKIDEMNARLAVLERGPRGPVGRASPTYREAYTAWLEERGMTQDKINVLSTQEMMTLGAKFAREWEADRL